MQPPPALPGMPLADVDTPALLIDLDAFERNLARMAGAVAKAGVRLRGHAKTHKSPIIALRQMAQGAVGVCCQKVSEAEVMVAGGVPDVLVSNEVVGTRKLERLALLARRAKIGVCVDNADNVEALAQAAARFGSRLDALVEIDVGARRCGVAPGEAAVRLAGEVARHKSLRFAGLQSYHGAAQHVRDWAERKARIEKAIAATAETVALLKKAGLACDTVGGAGTGTFEMEAASGVYNELQAGSYIFMDADYARNKREDGTPFTTFEHALFVYATVMSTPERNRAIVDCGHKAAAVDSGMPEPYGLGGVTYSRPSDEHGLLDTTGANRPLRLGEKVRLVPGHCDPTVNLHDWYVCVRGIDGDAAHVEAVWPVAARGAGF
jgi:D-serine deaminase-like pyridoxal phosphate-dependent protein